MTSKQQKNDNGSNDKFDHLRRDFSPYGLACERWTPVPMPRSDRHNELELTILPAGRISFLTGGSKVTILPGRLAVFWGAIPHQLIETQEASEYFWCSIPLPWFLQWKLPITFVNRVLKGEFFCENDDQFGERDLIAFQQWQKDIRENTENRRKIMLLEIEARLRRLALREKQNREKQNNSISHGELSKAEQMAVFVAQHYTEPLRIQDIANAVDLHQDYAMRVFRKMFGTTLVNYVNQHRVMHAQRLLATTHDKVIAVAMDSGFSSLSRFNKVFKDCCGMSPRQFRNSCRPN